MAIEKTIVLAAGKGVRMQPLTLKKPKALVELKGRPLIEYVLEALEFVRIRKAVIVVGYKREQIMEYLKNKWNGIEINYAIQHEQKGTAHALKCAEKFIDENENFAVANSDVIINKEELKEIFRKAESLLKKNDAIVLARKSKEPWKYGCLLIEKNKLKEIVEKPNKGEEPSNLVNAGYYFFNAKIFDAIKRIGISARNEYEITDAINLIANEGKASFIETKAEILDVGTLEDLQKAEKIKF